MMSFPDLHDRLPLLISGLVHLIPDGKTLFHTSSLDPHLSVRPIPTSQGIGEPMPHGMSANTISRANVPGLETPAIPGSWIVNTALITVLSFGLLHFDIVQRLK